MNFDYDYLIVGSGFGGSVSALRLAEKGWRVAVLEQGRRIGPDEIKQGKDSPRKLMWMPKLGMRGYFVQHMFQHVSIVGGVGVGGGSIVWGAVMLEPKDSFYEDPKLAALGLNLRDELAPHFVTARRMLGVQTNPRLTRQDHLLKQTAEDMGVGNTFGSVPNAIYFGETGQTHSDPYFEGEGPQRMGCTFCGGCLTGCEYNAKNSLYLNYLYLAEKKGVQILPDRKVDRIAPLPQGGYQIDWGSPGWGSEKGQITAAKVIISAGVVGSLELLFRNRDVHGTLPKISPTLGEVVRTNSEAITSVLQPKGEDMTDGAAISSDFYPNQNTHITQNRLDRGYNIFRYMMGPMIDDPVQWRRVLKTLLAFLLQPKILFSNLFGREWVKRMTIFTIMQDLNNYVGMRYKRAWWWPFGKRLLTVEDKAAPLPSYLPVANETTRVFAQKGGGTPMSLVTESILGTSTTAHILSGCPMGDSAADSVIDTRHEVHGAPGLFVVDGSSIPANIGVNPSLTITAMAERFAALQPAKSENA